MGWGKDSAGHWEFYQAPRGIRGTQIGLGVFLLFVWGWGTKVGGAGSKCDRNAFYEIPK